MKRIIAAAVLIFAGFAAPVLAAAVVSTDALREWNLIVFGNVTSKSEVEGRTFIGGNLEGSSSNYMIRTPAASPTGQPGLTVVGNVTGDTKNLNNGSGAVIGGNVTSGFNLNGPAQTVKVGGTIANTNVNQNTVQSGLAASNQYFLSDLNQQKSLLQSSLTDLSGSLSRLPATNSVTIANNRATFVAAPQGGSAPAVFNLTAAQLATFGEIALNVNGADTVVINVSGETINLDDNFLGGTTGLGERVIWNFYQAKTLTLSTAWGGSVLAPLAAATTGNYIEGSAVFASLTQNGEFHLGTYKGGYYPPLVPPGGDTSTGGGTGTRVPEPATWLFLAGAMALLWSGRRFRVRR